ncbi:hypothetical protein D3C76_112830 [compost metagenome]
MEKVEGNVHLIGGKIRDQYADHCCLHVHDIELADYFEQFVGKCVTVRYWVNDRALESVDQAVELTLEEAFGQGAVHANCTHHWSEVTGYLYTTENAKVGGHDLIAELESWVGKFVLMEIKVHEGEEPLYHPDDCRSGQKNDPRSQSAHSALLTMLRKM